MAYSCYYASMKRLFSLFTAAVLFVALPAAAQVIRPIEFPVNGQASYSDDYGDARSGGRIHEGIDVLASKMTPLIAAVDGEVSWLTETEQSYGWLLALRDFEGWTYQYLHINNDTPGTDDSLGGRQYAFAPGIDRGVSVKKGQLVAWVGDSGNAENTGSHLHFEIHEPGGAPINPYQSLLHATRMGFYWPADETAASPTINVEKNLVTDPLQLMFCVRGSVIRSVSSPAVYYCGADGKRYVFPNSKIFNSWYKDFSGVQTITDIEMASIPLGGNVTYRPGVKLVKIQSDPKVYAVAHGGTLRWVTTTALAAKLYGLSWAKKIDDIDVVYWRNYTVGDPIIFAN